METWAWIVVAVLVLAVGLLLQKLLLVRKSADEIRRAFGDRLQTDTNTLIDISSRDRHMLLLADAINTQLRQLRTQRQRHVQGDAELKEAVTNMAHDLRTPLTAISGYLQLLEREEKTETVSRYLDLIENRTTVLRHLTEELFRYSILSSRPEIKLEPVIMNNVLEECFAAAYSALTQRGIIPEISMPESRVERILDRSALSRVFENIIANAIKYSDGDLHVQLGMDGTIVFSNASERLDPVLVGRLFDRFYTVETGREATGLGLSIAKLMTERMGGSIGAEYRNGRLAIALHFTGFSANDLIRPQ